MATFSVVAWRAGFFCSECMGPTPLNAVVSRMQCAHCLSSIDVMEQIRRLSKVFGSWGPPSLWSTGTLRTDQHVDGMRTEADVRVAVCRACQAPFESEDVAAASMSSSGVACRGCGERAAVRFADDLVQFVTPSARLVIGEADASAGSRAPVPSVLCACLQCGAALAVDGTKRVVACTYCQSSNFISDALWLRMHPAHKKQWVYFSP